jgi:hypothetical protein
MPEIEIDAIRVDEWFAARLRIVAAGAVPINDEAGVRGTALSGPG